MGEVLLNTTSPDALPPNLATLLEVSEVDIAARRDGQTSANKGCIRSLSDVVALKEDVSPLYQCWGIVRHPGGPVQDMVIFPSAIMLTRLLASIRGPSLKKPGSGPRLISPVALRVTVPSAPATAVSALTLAAEPKDVATCNIDHSSEYVDSPAAYRPRIADRVFRTGGDIHRDIRRAGLMISTLFAAARITSVALMSPRLLIEGATK